MSTDMVRIKTGVQMSSIAGSTVEDYLEIPRAEWEALTADGREKRLEEIAQEVLANEVSAWACVEEGD